MSRSQRVVETSREGLQRQHSETTVGTLRVKQYLAGPHRGRGHKQATATARTKLTHKKSKTRGAALGWGI